VGVLTVVAGSPAARAGIIAGDTIIRVGDIRSCRRRPVRIERPETRSRIGFEDLVRTTRTVLQVERDGTQVEITLEPSRAARPASGWPGRTTSKVCQARHVVLIVGLARGTDE
jgi:C-terminal processing protease CtpA/Prc